ncbi:peroxisomal (s)-2-hydroxy-acid oxidase glo4 [Quercus suber]|uniref:Peroxisomal (S)-2-hydroxy-acid oxidase glo4 n=1 Tax=Quercus suber TaxID=58331 RepID=A0AAW0JRU2_QUESU
MVAPSAMHKLAHPEGPNLLGREIATARAAAASNTIMILSSMSSCTIEEVASSCNAIQFFQLYVFNPSLALIISLMKSTLSFGCFLCLCIGDPVVSKYIRTDVAAQLVQRAERNGYKAIVLTNRLDLKSYLKYDCNKFCRMIVPPLKNIEGLVSTEVDNLSEILLFLLTESDILQDEGSILEGFAKAALDASLCWRVALGHSLEAETVRLC